MKRQQRMWKLAGCLLLCVMLCAVSVPALAQSRVYMNFKNVSMACKATKQLSVKVVPPLPEGMRVTWQSSNSAVATVDQTGLVTAGRIKGIALIRAMTPDGASASTKVTVHQVRVAGVTLSDSQKLMEVGEELTLKAVIKPANATIDTVKWTSSDERVATVMDGKVTALAQGRATITARAGAKGSRCAITVKSSAGAPDTREVTITAVGDVTIGGDPRKPPANPASEKYYDRLYDSYDGKFFKKVNKYFDGPDEITLVNLEGSFTNSMRLNGRKSYTFRAKPAYASILAGAGVDVVGHANNHAEDFSDSAAATRAAVRAHDMAYMRNAQTAIVNRGGVRVGLCAFYAINANAAITSQAKNVVQSLNRQCDLVVSSVHWGKEYSYSPNASQRNFGRMLVSSGADLVVGHHSHVLNGVEKYKGKYIAYSLGTLSSAIKTPRDMDAVIYQQTFTVDPQNGAVGEGTVKLIPCSMSSSRDVNDAMPEPLTGANRARVLGKIRQASNSFIDTLPEECFH
ncbi:MAG: CapA family protein [Clostridia bacterium]